jgi:hypothetical protein
MIKTLASEFKSNNQVKELGSFSFGSFKEGGIIRPFADNVGSKLGRVPKEELERLFFENGIIRNSVSRMVQMIESAGYRVLYTNQNEQNTFEEFFKDIGMIGDECDFEEIYLKIPKNQIIFGAGWNELLWDENETEILDMNSLDPKKMDYARNAKKEIVLGKDLKPIGYTKKIPEGYTFGKQTNKDLGDFGSLPKEFRGMVDLGSDKIFLLPKRIALIRYETEGDGLEFWGLIETIYKDSIRKGKLEEAGFNSAFQRWMSPLIAYAGDDTHPPTPQLAKQTLETMQKMKHDLLSVYPYYVKLDTVQGNEMDSYVQMLKSFRENEASGLQTPMPFAMSSGETTNRACYSEDTQVLTKNGWLNYKDVGDKEIAIYDKEKDEIRFEKHGGLYEYDYDGEMINFKGKSTDILVTPDHKMLFRKNSPSRKDLTNNKEWIVDKAEDIDTYYYSFKKNARWDDKEKYPAEFSEIVVIPSIDGEKRYSKEITMGQGLFNEFLGYFLSEGGISHKGKSYTITFAQKEPKVEKMRKCFNEMPFHFTEYFDEKDQIWRFSVSDKRLWNFMKKFGNYCNDKHLGDFIYDYREYSQRLFDAMMLGDGTWERENEKGCYYTTSEKMAGDFVALAMRLGYSANISTGYEETEIRSKMYRVHLIKDRTEITHTQKSISKINYDGKVYCFNTSTGFFLTMRNGKVAIQGNTLNNQQAMMEFGLNALAKLNARLITKKIFMPIALSKGMTTWPTLVPNRVKVEEIDDLAVRYSMYVRDKIFTANEVRQKLAEAEGFILPEQKMPEMEKEESEEENGSVKEDEGSEKEKEEDLYDKTYEEPWNKITTAIA